MNSDSSPSGPQYPGNQYPGNRHQQGTPYGAPPPGYAPPPGHGPQGYAQPWRPSKPFSNKAIVSVVMAGCGLFLFPLGIITNLVGMGLAFSGMKDTHPQNGTRRGRGMAVAGFWTNLAMWVITAAFGAFLVFVIMNAVEQGERHRVERQADWAREDMHLIEERLELYYVENGSSLSPGGPVVRDGWGGGLYPEDHPRVSGQPTVEDLVYSYELMNTSDGYELKITGAKSATITHRQSGKKLVITDVGMHRSRFEG